MKSAIATANVDYRLLGQLSDLVVCSRCLKRGKATPVPQVISPRHTPRTLCASCTRPGRQRDLRQILKTLIAP
jgi:hypothetical protein